MATREVISRIEGGDVIRARRYGNRTKGTYTIEDVGRFQVAEGTWSAYAHRQYSQKRGKFMTFDADSIRVIASYR